MLQSATAAVLRRLTPETEADTRVRIEQVRAVAQTFCSTALANPFLAVLVSFIALQWVGPWRVLPWLGGVLITVTFAILRCRRILARASSPAGAAPMTLELMVAILPFMFIWPLIVVTGWVKGEPYNNAFFVALMFASMAGGVPVASPLRPLILCNMLIDIPILATHVISGTRLMAWIAPPLQILAGLVMYDLYFTCNKLATTSILQRHEKEDLVQRLTQTGKQLKRTLDDAERATNAKSAFLASMSHELRTPLNAIIGFSEMIRMRIYGPLESVRYSAYVDDIYNSGTHLLALINNILDIAKIESGKRTFTDAEIDVANVSRDALAFVETQAKKGDIALRSSIEEGVRLFADERAVLQILTNLLSNAVKFTKPGGAATVFLKRLPDGGLALGVEDDGIGMNEEDLEKALQPYGQAHDAMTVEGHGTGLGLPIVQSLLEAQEAKFRIESQSGVGTRVWGEFPPSRTIMLSAVA